MYKACVRSVLTYGAEAWALNAPSLVKLRSAERRMLRMMCGVTLKDLVRSDVIAERLNVDCIEDYLRTKRLRWFGHVMRRDVDVDVRRLLDLHVDGRRKPGRPATRWMDVVIRSVTRDLVNDRVAWKRAAVLGLDNPRKR